MTFINYENKITVIHFNIGINLVRAINQTIILFNNDINLIISELLHCQNFYTIRIVPI